MLFCCCSFNEPGSSAQDYGVIMFLRGRSVPTLHYRRKTHWSESQMTNSADILAYLAGRFGHEQRGAFLAHSAQTEAVEAKVDEAMERGRRLFYYHVLQADNGALTKLAPTLWGTNEVRLKRFANEPLSFAAGVSRPCHGFKRFCGSLCVCVSY